MTISLSLYKKIRDNKELIIKNYRYRTEVGYNIKNQYKKFSEKLEKNNREIVPEINKEALENISLNNIILKKIIILFNKSHLRSIDILICYTPKIQLDKIDDEKRDKLLNNYEEIFNSIPNIEDIKNRKSSIKKDFNDLLIEIAKSNKFDCAEFDIIRIPINKFIKKLKTRQMTYGKYDDKWHFIIYNEIIFYIKPSKDKKSINLCINKNFILNNDSDWFIEFIETEYSPIFDAKNDISNLPETTYIQEPLHRRKSIAKLSKITYNEIPNKLGTYTPTQYFDPKNLYKEDSIFWDKKDKHIKYKIREVMQCFRNEKNTDGKHLFDPARANYRREPFIKQVINFPPIFENKASNKGGKILKCDLELVKKIRFELTNMLALIKIKYPPKKDKEYFLIDLAGGATKHFDYSLYSFTEDELNEQQDEFLVKKNLWKKLEFKSNAKAETISDLAMYLSKTPITLFDTVNGTFGNEFIKMTQNIILHKKWLKKHINNNEYFTQAIENILQGQKDKIYIIWNVRDQKIYLDNFLDNELKINRDTNNKPQIYLDEEKLNNGYIRIIIKTGESEHFIDYKKSKLKKSKENDEDEENDEENEENDDENGGRLKSGFFRFCLKRNSSVFLDDKFKNKLKKLNIEIYSRF